MSTTLLNAATAFLGAIGQGFGTSPISLGGITFQGVEVPSELPRPGEHNLIVRKLPGGARIINTLGPDPGARSFSGMFTGPGALARSLEMEAMRDAGAQVALQYLGYSETVVVKSYTPRLAQRGAVIAFSVEVEVLPTLAAAAAPTDTLSTSVGAYTTDALSAVTDAITAAAAYTSTTPAMGEVTTVAAISAGALAALSVDLTTASGLSTSITASPATLAAYVATMQQGGADAMTTISLSSGSLTGISAAAANGIASDAASLQAAAAHAELIASAVQAGGYINASLAGVAQLQGAPQPLPVVHA